MNQKEIREFFEEFIKKNKLKIDGKNFKNFLEFLKIDFCDWERENLKCYFREGD